MEKEQQDGKEDKQMDTKFQFRSDLQQQLISPRRYSSPNFEPNKMKEIMRFASSKQLYTLNQQQPVNQTNEKNQKPGAKEQTESDILKSSVQSESLSDSDKQIYNPPQQKDFKSYKFQTTEDLNLMILKKEREEIRNYDIIGNQRDNQMQNSRNMSSSSFNYSRGGTFKNSNIYNYSFGEQRPKNARGTEKSGAKRFKNQLENSSNAKPSSVSCRSQSRLGSDSNDAPSIKLSESEKIKMKKKMTQDLDTIQRQVAAQIKRIRNNSLVSSVQEGEALQDIIRKKQKMKQNNKSVNNSKASKQNSLSYRSSKTDSQNQFKLVTILFMSHRIQAKIFHSDTYDSFLDRLRKILPNVDPTKQIGLYHLHFLKQEEMNNSSSIQQASSKDGKKEKSKARRRYTKSMSFSIQSCVSLNESQSCSQISRNSKRSGSQMSKDASIGNSLIPVPLTEHHIIKSLDQIIENQNFLLVYIDEIEFSSPFTSGIKRNMQEDSNTSQLVDMNVTSTVQQSNKLYHDTLPLGKTYYKVLRGKSTANKLLFCPFSSCVKQFFESGNLKTHSRIHTGSRPFLCSFEGCNKSFITRGHLQTHILIHTGEKPYKCEVCGKRYNRSNRLKIHERTHTGVKPFVCEICGKSFTENGNLKTHMRIHTGEKPFRCEFKGCGKSFTTQGHLIDHRRKHTNSRIFKCEHCDNSFVRQSSLKIHCKRQHSKELGGQMDQRSHVSPKTTKTHEYYECECCGKNFKVEEQYIKHLKCHEDTEQDNEQDENQISRNQVGPLKLEDSQKPNIADSSSYNLNCTSQEQDIKHKNLHVSNEAMNDLLSLELQNTAKKPKLNKLDVGYNRNEDNNKESDKVSQASAAQRQYFKLVAPQLKINLKEVNKENQGGMGDEKRSDMGLQSIQFPNSLDVQGMASSINDTVQEREMIDDLWDDTEKSDSFTEEKEERDNKDQTILGKRGKATYLKDDQNQSEKKKQESKAQEQGNITKREQKKLTKYECAMTEKNKVEMIKANKMEDIEGFDPTRRCSVAIDQIRRESLAKNESPINLKKSQKSKDDNISVKESHATFRPQEGGLQPNGSEIRGRHGYSEAFQCINRENTFAANSNYVNFDQEQQKDVEIADQSGNEINCNSPDNLNLDSTIDNQLKYNQPINNFAEQSDTDVFNKGTDEKPINFPYYRAVLNDDPKPIQIDQCKTGENFEPQDKLQGQNTTNEIDAEKNQMKDNQNEQTNKCPQKCQTDTAINESMIKDELTPQNQIDTKIQNYKFRPSKKDTFISVDSSNTSSIVANFGGVKNSRDESQPGHKG